MSLLPSSFRFAAACQPMADLVFKPDDRFWVQTVTRGRAIDIPGDQPRLTQHLEMLADGGLGQGGEFDDLAGDTDLLLRQDLDDLKTHRVAQRLEHFVQALFIRSQRAKNCVLFYHGFY